MTESQRIPRQQKIKTFYFRLGVFFLFFFHAHTHAHTCKESSNCEKTFQLQAIPLALGSSWGTAVVWKVVHVVGLRSAEVAGVCRIRGQRSPAEDPGLVWVASLQKAGTGTISGSKLQQERALPSVPTWKREGGKKEKKYTIYSCIILF